MAIEDNNVVKLSGVGTNRIDFEVLDEGARDRVMECLRKNGKISIMVGEGRISSGDPDGGFAQKID
ncbi:hypothetical protein ACFOKI_02970 [Sphingomonas qilianensis]|uniref:Uncharacterized protein n=1 Tax=Sphingomonas qilianensis TaxID=1736690 RepID=A0ABU9XVH4_9SPHN